MGGLREKDGLKSITTCINVEGYLSNMLIISPYSSHPGLHS